MTYEISSIEPEATSALGAVLGAILKGGEIIELVGDLGVGKTQFVRGLAKGAGSSDVVQSPSFTISRVYKAKKFDIYHYDFYRLGEDVGMMRDELGEHLGQDDIVVVTEWADTVSQILLEDRLQIEITYGEDKQSRKLAVRAFGPNSAQILGQLK